MRLYAIILTLLAPVGLAAQPAQINQSAGINIVRVSLQPVRTKPPSVRAVPSTDPASQRRENADRQRGPDNNPALHRMSKDAEIAPLTNQNPFSAIPTQPAVIFVASVVVKNTGTKPISRVQWEYHFFRTGETEPVKTYTVNSKKLIPPGEQAELTKEVKPKGNEHQARITRIEYADGSVWQSN